MYDFTVLLNIDVVDIEIYLEFLNESLGFAIAIPNFDRVSDFYQSKNQFSDRIIQF